MISGNRGGIRMSGKPLSQMHHWFPLHIESTWEQYKNVLDDHSMCSRLAATLKLLTA